MKGAFKIKFQVKIVFHNSVSDLEFWFGFKFRSRTSVFEFNEFKPNLEKLNTI